MDDDRSGGSGHGTRRRLWRRPPSSAAPSSSPLSEKLWIGLEGFVFDWLINAVRVVSQVEYPSLVDLRGLLLDPVAQLLGASSCIKFSSVTEKFFIELNVWLIDSHSLALRSETFSIINWMRYLKLGPVLNGTEGVHYSDQQTCFSCSGSAVGDYMSVKGPKGHSKYQVGQVRAFGMLAGGPGITPMFQDAMARVLHLSISEVPVYIADVFPQNMRGALGSVNQAIPGMLLALVLFFDNPKFKDVNVPFDVSPLRWNYVLYALTGYGIGLIAALAAGILSESPQPALLYLVPSTLGPVMGLCLSTF